MKSASCDPSSEILLVLQAPPRDNSAVAIPYQDILCYSTAALLIPTALWLGWWSLLRDRARGRRRCPKCWYDLRGTPGMQCSECGSVAKREQHFRRTRRRWKLAILSLLPLAGGMYAAMWPKASRDGWMSFVPRPILIVMSPGVLEESGLWYPRRGNTPNRLAKLQLMVFQELDRRTWARPISSEWEWRYVLRHKSYVWTRDRWPIGVPLVVYFQIPSWVRPPTSVSVDFRSSPQSYSSAHFEDEVLFYPDDPVGCSIAGTPRQLLDELPLAWNETYSTSAGMKESRSVGLLDLRVRIVPTMEDAISAARGTALDAAMLRALKLNVALIEDHGNGRLDARIRLEMDREGALSVKDIAFGFKVDFLRDGDVVALADLDRLPTNFTGSPARPAAVDMGYARINDFPWDDFNSDRAGDHWRVRVRGDATLGLRDWNADHYWAGECLLRPADVINPD